MVCRPKIIVIVGKHEYGLHPEKLQVLYDRVRTRGPIEALTYEDIYEFAKECYQSNQVLVTAAVFHPDPLLGVSEQLLDLFGVYVETNGFDHFAYRAGRESMIERNKKALEDAGLIRLRVHDENEPLGYELTKMGIDIHKRIHHSDPLPNDKQI